MGCDAVLQNIRLEFNMDCIFTSQIYFLYCKFTTFHGMSKINEIIFLGDVHESIDMILSNIKFY